MPISYSFKIVAQTVEKWVPKRRYASESKYEDDLRRFLRIRLGSEDYNIEKGDILDIEINGEIGIELKRNLKSQTETTRLIGQITRFMHKHSYALVVLCGDVEQRTVKDLNNLFKRYTSNSSLVQNKILRIVPKDKCQKKEDINPLLQKVLNKPRVSLIDYMRQTHKEAMTSQS
jgi:bifunctional DNA-binding transcriptional regulator/antitoxin component of YhaV-PrlF toxin-antitoxin module